MSFQASRILNVVPSATTAVTRRAAELTAMGREIIRLSEGEPLPTSYGEDSYRKIFGRGVEATAVSATDG